MDGPDLSSSNVPHDDVEARKLRIKAIHYYLIDRVLYQKSFHGPYLKCLGLQEVQGVMTRTHEGYFGNHAEVHSLANQIPPQDTSGRICIWMLCNMPTCAIDVSSLPRFCINHQQIIEPFQVRGHLWIGSWMWWVHFLMYPFRITTDYFTKWVEAEAYADVKDIDIRSFLRKNIICRFGNHKAIITNNGTKFESRLVQLCEEFPIKHFIQHQGIQKVMVRRRLLIKLISIF